MLLALAATGIAVCAAAQNVAGVIVDRGRANADPTLARAPYVHVFDPASMQITASVPLPLAPFTGVFDVEIAPDLGKAYVSDFDDNQIWIIDLTISPASLASGTP